MARMLEKNPKFIRESIYAEQLDGQARKILRGYAVGRLLVPGDNRFLSGDLLELLRQLIAPRVFQLPGERDFCNQVMGDFFAEDSFFAPGAAYDHETAAPFSATPTLPGTRNCSCRCIQRETNCASITWATSPMWSWCLQTVWRRSGWAERLRRRLIKTIADPILNRCVKRNYDYDVHQQLSNNANLPC